MSLNEDLPPYFIDGHLDIAYVGMSGRSFSQRVAPASDACLSLPDLRDAPVRVALGTIFTEARTSAPGGYVDSSDIEGAHRAGVAQMSWYRSEEDAGRIRILRTRDDVLAAACIDEAQAPLGIVLLMEGADPLRTPDEAQWWYDQGVRVVGMSWAYGSRYSGGNAEGGPLTPAGRDLVRTLDALGILHDVSHLSDRSFDDLLTLTPRRVVASHSNCRALLAPKERHLTDAQIRSIGARDGLVGLNLFGSFLAVDRPATLDDCVAHSHHVAHQIGPERVGLGSDLDGGFPASGLPIGVQHPRQFRSLAHAIDIPGFAATNWLRSSLNNRCRDYAQYMRQRTADRRHYSS